MNVQGNVADLVVGNAVVGTLADDLPALFGYGVLFLKKQADILRKRVGQIHPAVHTDNGKGDMVGQRQQNIGIHSFEFLLVQADNIIGDFQINRIDCADELV